MKYKIVNGKLADEQGNPVSLEIGNREQIDFIKTIQSRIDDFENEGVELSVSYEAQWTASLMLECVCNHRMWIELEASDEYDADCFDDYERKCYKCGTNYILKVDEDGKVFAKINR